MWAFPYLITFPQRLLIHSHVNSVLHCVSKIFPYFIPQKSGTWRNKNKNSKIQALKVSLLHRLSKNFAKSYNNCMVSMKAFFPTNKTLINLKIQHCSLKYKLQKQTNPDVLFIYNQIYLGIVFGWKLNSFSRIPSQVASEDLQVEHLQDNARRTSKVFVFGSTFSSQFFNVIWMRSRASWMQTGWDDLRNGNFQSVVWKNIDTIIISAVIKSIILLLYFCLFL